MTSGREIAAVAGRTAEGPHTVAGANVTSTSARTVRTVRRVPTGLTSRNMRRVSAACEQSGAREYGEILGRHVYSDVTGIPAWRRLASLWVLLDAFRARFGEAKRALSSGEYTQILRICA